jgi:hypothetical protein
MDKRAAMTNTADIKYLERLVIIFGPSFNSINWQLFTSIDYHKWSIAGYANC